MSNPATAPTECSKSPTGKHDPVSPPGGSLGFTTAMPGGMREGTLSVICSWCGVWGSQGWHDEERRVEGRGPYATRVHRVTDGLYWHEQP